MNKETALFGLGVLGVITLIAIVLLWPLAIIWAVNTLLAPVFSIPYSFLSWLAVVVLNISTFGGINYTLNKIKEKI